MRIKRLDELNKPYNIYTTVLETEALDQFIDAMQQKEVVKGALMPDAHSGYTLPIGGVVALKGNICPAYVGYDIGCGVCALKTTFKKTDIKEKQNQIFDSIYELIPVGFEINPPSKAANYSLEGLTSIGQKIASEKQHNRQLGTLGGGNHFIEIGYDENDNVWIIIHSGSRGVGHGLATHYMKLAFINIDKMYADYDEKHQQAKRYQNKSGYEKNRKKAIDLLIKKAKADEGHHYLDVNTQEGKDYITDLKWCLNYALENRKIMLERVMDAILRFCYGKAKWETLINRNHNHAELKDGLWIHRKGATHAEKDMLGVIPGNMRDGCYIVKGKGNPDSLCSSSHGAGRQKSRSKAKKDLNVDVFKFQMEGIKSSASIDTLDEAPGAYKNFDDVMNNQKDLIEKLYHIKPLINIKDSGKPKYL